MCHNDRGGMRMGVSEGVSGTLRADMGGHPPHRAGQHDRVGRRWRSTSAPPLLKRGVSGTNRPVLFENHSQDGRYRTLEVAPTLQASCGMGGNNQPVCDDARPMGSAGQSLAAGRKPEEQRGCFAGGRIYTDGP